MTNFQKIAKWFKSHGNEPATFAEVCKAFPSIKRKTISALFSKKIADSNGHMCYVFPAWGERGHYQYFLNPGLPIYREVENFSNPEEVEIKKVPANEFFTNEEETSEVKTNATQLFPEKEKPQMTNFQKIAKWFKSHGNEPTTFADICKAFPDIKQKTISALLSKKIFNSNEKKPDTYWHIFQVVGKRGHYKYFLNPELPIYREVKTDEVPADTFFANEDEYVCEGDCSHCEIGTCVFKDKAKTSENEVKTEVETKIKDRIVNWFRYRENEPAFLWEVEEAFPDIDPKTISEILSKEDSNGKSLFEEDYDYNYGTERTIYSLWDEDYAPSASEKPVAEVKTLDSLLKVLKSIDKHLAQIAEVETSNFYREALSK